MKRDVGMWWRGLVLLGTVILSMGYAALLATQTAAYPARVAQASLASGASGLDGAAPAARAAGSPHRGVADARGAAGALVLLRGDHDQQAGPGQRSAVWHGGDPRPGLPIFWQAAGAEVAGAGIPLWDLLATFAMLVTFGVLVGSWARRSH